MNKILGIIGGMGPMATVNFYKQIIQMTDAGRDQDHIRIIIDSNTNISDRTDAIIGNGKSPLPALLDSAKKLESLKVDGLTMPCNTAHYYYEDIKKNINIPFLNMIEETALNINSNYSFIKKAGLLATEGTCKANIYEKYFSKYNIQLIKPAEKYQHNITEVIYNIKKGNYDRDLSGLFNTLKSLNDKGVEIFILGCTELSFAFEHFRINATSIDPIIVLAKRAIKFMGKNIKRNFKD